MPATILLIEDDQQIRDLLPRYLQKEGMSTLAAADGRTGLQIVAERNVDLILLDVNLPDIDGWSILRRLRGSASSQPAVIMLTGRSDVPDRLLGLDLGADDYIIKPFEPLEVVARVKAVLRRLRGHKETEELEFPGLRISLIGRAAWRQERALNLSMKEFDLLVALASNPGRVMTRFSLYDLVWGGDGQGDDHTLDVHMNRLRGKLSGADGLSYVVTLKGVGYKFEVHDDHA